MYNVIWIATVFFITEIFLGNSLFTHAGALVDTQNKM